MVRLVCLNMLLSYRVNMIVTTDSPPLAYYQCVIKGCQGVFTHLCQWKWALLCKM